MNTASATANQRPEPDPSLFACDQSTGRECFVRTGPRAELEAEAVKQNALGRDYFVTSPRAPAHAVQPAPSPAAGLDHAAIQAVLAEMLAVAQTEHTPGERLLWSFDNRADLKKWQQRLSEAITAPPGDLPMRAVAGESPDTPAALPPKVVVSISGGVLQNVVANQPVQVVLVDYDVDGDTESSTLRAVPSTFAGRVEQAYVSRTSVDVTPIDCDVIFGLADGPQTSDEDVASLPAP